MLQLDNLDVTLRRLRLEKGWCTKKESHFVAWLDKNNHVKKGQKPGSRMVEDLYKKIQTFENLYRED